MSWFWGWAARHVYPYLAVAHQEQPHLCPCCRERREETMATIQRGTAFLSPPFFATDSNQEGVRGISTWQAYASRAGALFQTIEVSVADVGMGWYTLSLGPAQTQTVGPLTVMLMAAGVRPVKFQLVVKE